MVIAQQGTDTVLFVTFQNVEGVETAATSPTITITHIKDGTVVDVNAEAMTLVSGTTGQYYYTWTISATAYIGNYSVAYAGTVESKSATASETISVIKGTSLPDLDYYNTTLQAARYAGIGVAVEKENLGTGDNVEDSYDTAFGNILATSYTISYGDADSNSLTALIETDDYSISKDDGRILLTSAGVTKVNAKVIYIDYTYSPKQSNTVLLTYLPMAQAEVDKITGNYWGDPKTSVQYFDGYRSGYPQTDKPYGEQIEEYPEYTLKYAGVSSITSVLFLDRSGNTDTTLDSDQYRIFTDDDFQESRLLINTTIPNGKANIQVTMVHGYDSVPVLIQELASYITGMMALVNISGGSYKDISTYSFPEGSVSIGQVYVNIRESIDQMKKRIEAISLELGSNFDCV